MKIIGKVDYLEPTEMVRRRKITEQEALSIVRAYGSETGRLASQGMNTEEIEATLKQEKPELFGAAMQIFEQRNRVHIEYLDPQPVHIESGTQYLPPEPFKSGKKRQSASDQFDAAIKEIAHKEGISYDQALGKACELYPNLFDAYRKEL